MKLTGFAATLLLSSVAAQADVSISNKPTQNMSCSAGVCTATAQAAVLNVGDLQAMLGSGDVAVKTGSAAKDINVDQPVSWPSTTRLTLDAQQSVVVKRPVTVAGTGALTVITNDGGSEGDLLFNGKGNVTFWDLSSSLTIGGKSYTLVPDIKTLAHDVSKKPSGFYALARSYDASTDGTYTSSPIETPFDGTLEGLGNKFSNFVLKSDGSGSASLFATVGANGTVRDLGVVRSAIESVAWQGAALLSQENYGGIIRCWATGSIHFSGAASIGGLVSFNYGVITNSSVNVSLGGSTYSGFDLSFAGGLVGLNAGTITSSYALGSVAYRNASRGNLGGLVGENAGNIENSYALTRVKSGRGTGDDNNFGGLVGAHDSAGSVSSSYAAGEIIVPASASPGGLIGFDANVHVKDTYWNLDDGVSEPSQGAGNKKNARGITGLTTQQLQSGLPDGFKPSIWTQAPDINNGYPYLRANPPR